MIETIECIDHINSWKWWKGNNPDLPNAAMEMVDVLHFVISHELVHNNCDVESVGTQIHQKLTDFDKGPIEESARDYVGINDELENLAGGFIRREIDYRMFMKAVNFCGLSAENLCLWYLGKNALNNFRQANGYKQGTYHKAWFGGEDNDTLIDIINSKIDQRPADMSIYDFITDQLTEQYRLALQHKH